MNRNTLVVILNYRTADLTCECLDSLASERLSEPDFSVVVVDNCSNDGSADRIQAHIHQKGWEWATLMARSVNDGFAAGNNAAIQDALDSPTPPRYFWLLNPDTIVRPGAYAALRHFLQLHPEVGIAGSRLEHRDGTPQQSAFRFPGIMSEFERGIRLGLVSRVLDRWLVAPPVEDRPISAEWLSGASLLVRREVFQDVGLLDSRYFLYFEETDFFWRAKERGWQSWYVPQSRVVHLVGQSTGVGEKKNAAKRQPWYLFDSRRRYFEKNHGFCYASFCDVSWLCGHFLWHLRRILESRPSDDPPYLVRDFLAGLVGNR